ncbi:MAG: hypothetical protein CK430_06545 [Legionella sp.]|nr:MAG: hypothetical protein CK430_06545 [Legionella sp.]
MTYVAARISTLFFKGPIDKEHRQLANTLINILSGGLSILLVFIIINTWGYLMQARDNTSKEADYLAAIIRNIAVFPPEPQAKIYEATKNYTVAVRVDEWQTMQRGQVSQKAADALEALYASVQAFQPSTRQQFYFYSRVIADINSVLQARRERLNKMDSVIPEPLKISLLIGSIILAIILGGIRGEYNFLNITPALLFAVSLGFNIALALSFDYPYSGSISVSNKLFYSGVLGRFPD